MGSTVILGGVPVEISSDLGRQFVVDCTRAGEGLISDPELAEIYEISPADWQNIAKDAALGPAICAELDRRVRNGPRHARQHPNILSSPRRARRIMSMIKRTRAIASKPSGNCGRRRYPSSPNSPSQSDRFIIQINLGSDVEIYNKPIAVGVDDVAPDAQPKLTAQPKAHGYIERGIR